MIPRKFWLQVILPLVSFLVLASWLTRDACEWQRNCPQSSSDKGADRGQ